MKTPQQVAKSGRIIAELTQYSWSLMWQPAVQLADFWPLYFTLVYKLPASIGKPPMFVKKTVSKLPVTVAFVSLFAMTTQTFGQHHAPTPEQLYVDRDRTESCPNCNHKLPKVCVYGWRGSPYFEANRGGCKCGKKSGLTWYNGNRHWQSPFSVLLDHGRKGIRNSKTADTRHPRFRDCLDVFAKVRVLPPVRCDNGYTGLDCDPYGLLGESRRGVILDAVPRDQPSIGQTQDDLSKFAMEPNHSQPLPVGTNGKKNLDEEELVWQRRPAALQQLDSYPSLKQFDYPTQLWQSNLKRPSNVNVADGFNGLNSTGIPNALSQPILLADTIFPGGVMPRFTQGVEPQQDPLPEWSTMAEPGVPAAAKAIETSSQRNKIDGGLPSARMSRPTRLR